MDFDTPIDRRGSASSKWDKYQGKDILPLWVADMDFASPAAVQRQLQARIDHPVFGYTVPSEELVAVVQERLARLYDWRVDPEAIIWLPGLVCGLNVVARAIGQPGDAVITTTPVYPPFLSSPGNQDRRLITAPMVRRERWYFDLDALEAAVTSDTRLFFLCSPHNPTGRRLTREELHTITEFCERHDLILCSDEIHCDLLLDGGTHTPTATLSPAVAGRTITLMAPSKTFNLAGLGCSFAIIENPELRSRFNRAKAGIVPHVNLLGYEATLAAYRDGQDWLDACLAYLRGNHDRLQDTVAALPGLTMTPVEATYLGWIDARGLGLENPAQYFEDHGLGFNNGADFGLPGFVRFNFGCPRSTLDLALERLQTAVTTLAKSG